VKGGVPEDGADLADAEVQGLLEVGPNVPACQTSFLDLSAGGDELAGDAREEREHLEGLGRAA